MTSFVTTLEETLTLSDSRTNLTGKLAEETATATDSYTNLTSKLLSETGNLSDSYLNASGKLASETLTLTDSALKSQGKTLTETATLSDTASVVHVYLTVKYIRTTASAVESDVQTYLNNNVEPSNIKSINVVPIASDNFGVLIVHS